MSMTQNALFEMAVAPMPARGIGQCNGCQRVTVRDEMRLTVESIGCQHCGWVMTLDRIEGTVNTRKPCDSRCMGAVGPVCSCSCGGRNHGGGWL